MVIRTNFPDDAALDPNSPLPLYHQLVEIFRAEIATGNWKAGDAIPPERLLTERYAVSRATVRHALSALVSEGMLRREQGRGTYVGAMRSIVATLAGLTGHIEELQRQGIVVTVKVLAADWTPAPAPACVAFGVAPHTLTPHICRLAVLTEGPLVVIDDFLSPALEGFVDVAALDDKPMLTLLEQRGIRVLSGQQQIRAAAAERREAALLHVLVGSPVLVVTRTVYAARETAVEWSRAFYHPDRYAYQMELLRRTPG